MLKICLIGVGDWAAFVHGPALSRYATEHPGEVELAAVCVRKNVERAQEFCRKFGFKRVYTDLDDMIDKERPNACWSVTPINATRHVAGRLLERGVPVLLEKPPGASLTEAKELAEISKRTGTPNLVGFNRRWAPCTRRALEWAAKHGPFEYIYARMFRTSRMDEEFAYGTGIHLLDCIRALAEVCVGPIRSAQVARSRTSVGVYNFHVDITFASGARGRGDILPACGILDESYALYGAKQSIAYNLPWSGGEAKRDGEATLWIEGNLIEQQRWPIEPQYLSSGFYSEAEEFIAALREGRQPTPSIEEVVDSVALAEAVQQGKNIEFQYS